MKKILILGAGIYQVPLIKRAKELGLYSIIVSIKGNYPGFTLADKIYYLDTRDYNGILEVAKNERIDGIITTGTDVAVKVMGYVNDSLGLSGIGFDAAELSTDKSLMKKAFIDGGVSTSQFKKAYSKNDAIAFFEKVNRPVMLKPVDSSGSRGVSKVGSVKEINDLFDSILSYSQKDYLVVEEFVEGYEIGVDLFVKDHQVVLNAIHGKLTKNNGVTDVPIGHYFPFECSDTLRINIMKECENVVHAIGFNDCAVNMDVIISNDYPFILEASGRCGATCIPELISRHYGFDFYEIMIKTAMGEDIDFEKNKLIPCIGKLIVSDSNGIIKKQEIVNASSDIQFDYRIGDRVRKFHVGPDRLGHIIKNGTEINDKEEIEFLIDPE